MILSRWLYQFSLRLYQTGVRVSALLGGDKAKKWLKGRKDWRAHLKAAVRTLPSGPRVWLHAASLGEFEQGRPVLEQLKKERPHCRVILTFFSPSGYEQQRNFQDADIVAYLPMDGPNNARDFLDILQPQAALFVKYEFWYFYLKALRERRIPALLFAAAFRRDQPFFKWYGGLFRSVLHDYGAIQVQDEKSLSLLQTLKPQTKISLGGDTRYDRVLSIAAQAKSFEKIEEFRGNDRLLIAGSTWPADEAVLKEWFDQKPTGWKLVLAPHEIHEAHLQSIETLFEGQTIRYSQYMPGNLQPVLLIDNIGMLSSLYRYGHIAFIGGGFARSGIHNVLEPAVFGLPVLMGPHYEKFSEARLLVSRGYAQPVQNAAELMTAFASLSEQLAELRPELQSFIRQHAGATKEVMTWLNGVIPLT